MTRNVWKACSVLFVFFAVLPVATFAKGGAEQPAVAPSSSNAPMQITWMYRYSNSWFIQDVLDPMFNVKIKTNSIYRNDQQKYQIMIASGDAPDVFAALNNEMQLYNQGVTRSVPFAMIRKYEPDAAKAFDARPFVWLTYVAPDNPKAFAAVPGIAENVDGPIFWPSFRTDYAKNVGVALPDYDSTKVPMDSAGKTYYYPHNFTVQWFEDFLVKLRDGDANNDGKKDTVPMSGPGNDMANMFGSLLGAYGLPLTGNVSAMGVPNYEENGKLYPAPISPRMETFLTTMQKWYSMGLIDREFPTLNYQTYWQKVASGRVGLMFGTNASYTGTAPSRPPDNWITAAQAKAGVEVVIPNLPVGPDGTQGEESYLPVTSTTTGSSLEINKDVSDTKLAKILQIENYMEFTQKGWIGHAFGKPGAHFDWSGAPYDSPPIRRPLSKIPAADNLSGANQNQMALYPVYYLKGDPISTVKFLYPPKLWSWMQNIFYGSVGQKFSKHYYRWDLFGKTKLSSLYSQYGDTLNSMWAEYWVGAVTGANPLPQSWNGFVKQWLANGGQQFVDEMQKAPLVSALRQGKVQY